MFGKRPTIDVGVFLGNLNLDELINWINELEEYSEYEDIKDPNRVKFAKAMQKYDGKRFNWKEIEEERRTSQGGIAWWTN